MNNLIYTNNRVFIWLLGPSKTWKRQFNYTWLTIGTFQQKFDKNYLLSTLPAALRCYAKRNFGKLEIVEGVNFEFIDSLRNNSETYLLFFDNSGELICNSKASVDTGAAGRHRGLSTTYIRHNMFHPSKFGRDVELQNTHNKLFKSPPDVKQVSTLSAQLGIRSEVVDWYRDATSVPYGDLLIDLSPQTDERLRCCTSTGSIPLKFHIPDRLKLSNFLDYEHKYSVYFSNVPIIFPQMQKYSPSILPKRVYQVPLRFCSKFSESKPAKHKNTSRDTFSKRSSIALSKNNISEAKKRRSGIRKRVETYKRNYPSRP